MVPTTREEAEAVTLLPVYMGGHQCYTDPTDRHRVRAALLRDLARLIFEGVCR